MPACLHIVRYREDDPTFTCLQCGRSLFALLGEAEQENEYLRWRVEHLTKLLEDTCTAFGVPLSIVPTTDTP